MEGVSGAGSQAQGLRQNGQKIEMPLRAALVHMNELSPPPCAWFPNLGTLADRVHEACLGRGSVAYEGDIPTSILSAWMSPPSYYQFSYSNLPSSVYSDRSLKGDNASVEITDGLALDTAKTPILGLASVKFYDFEIVAITLMMHGVTLVAAEPFLFNDENYDDKAQNRMFRADVRAAMGTNRRSRFVQETWKSV